MSVYGGKGKRAWLWSGYGLAFEPGATERGAGCLDESNGRAGGINILDGEVKTSCRAIILYLSNRTR